MYNTFINQNANAFNLNLNDNFNNQSQSQILNFNKQKFNNIMSNGKYNNNNHDFDYNNNNNFNVYNYNNSFNNNNLNNNNFNNNNNYNNNNNANMMNMNMNMDMYNFLNTTWNMFQIYNSQKNKNFSTMRFVKKDSFDYIDPEKIKKVVNKTIIDIEPNYQGNKINIFFQDSRGTKVNVLSPFDISVKDLLKNYVTKMGLGENVIDSGIYFLFNGGKLKKDEKKNIYELGILNGTIIIVIDRNAVMGA
jgi:hypothetical protein